MIQLTLIRINNYSAWTVTPEPKREADLQIIQSNIYSDIQRLFSMKKSLVFSMRYDNMIAITNGLNGSEHERIINSINLRYPVSVSMSVSSGKTPYDAQKHATELFNGTDEPFLRVGSLAKIGDTIQIAHIDIDK